jgi:hypothetical protein
LFSYIGSSFRTCYEKFCEEKNLTPNIVTLKSGLEAFWMGDPDASYVIIYFHGKGFFISDPNSITFMIS